MRKHLDDMQSIDQVEYMAVKIIHMQCRSHLGHMF